MSIIQASNLNRIGRPSKHPIEPKFPLNNKNYPYKNGDEKLINTLKWAGIIAAGSLAVAGIASSIKKGKIPELESVKDSAGKTVHKIGKKVLTFENGAPMLDGKRVNGAFSFIAKNGAVVRYKNGVLKSATNVGKDAYKKIYDSNGLLKKALIRANDGTHKIFHYRDASGKITKIKDSINGTTQFTYKDDGTLADAIKNKKSLINPTETPPTDSTVETPPAESTVVPTEAPATPAEPTAEA